MAPHAGVAPVIADESLWRRPPAGSSRWRARASSSACASERSFSATTGAAAAAAALARARANLGPPRAGSDIAGRRPVFMFSLFVSSFFGLISALSPNIYIFALCRFLLGFGYGGNVRSRELRPLRARAPRLCVRGAFGAGGILLICPLRAATAQFASALLALADLTYRGCAADTVSPARRS
jgi:hypothetical protein